MKKLLSVLFMLSFTFAAVWAQNIQVKGTVVSGSDDYPLPGVNVVVKGTATGVITDIDGNFTISVPSDATLTFTYVGFKAQDVAVNGQITLNVVLQEDMETLEEVVVVGYGVQKKANLTGAVTSIKSDELLKAKSANSTNALVGQMPGLISKQATGEPGADDANLYIRGIATFQGDTSPAFIIDGIERTSADFARMDPNDIESINVLKDAASAAIFGMRGANGVIVITTKRGSSEKPTIKYSGNVSIQSPTRLPEFANSYDYARLYNQFMGQEIYSAEALQKFKDGSDPINYPNTDWYDEMLSKNAIQHQHNVSVSGGTDKIRYYVSLGYLRQGGLWEDLDYKRYNLRSNIDVDITKTTRLGVDVSGRMENSLNSGSAQGVFQQLVRNTPVLLCRYPNGLFAVPDATHPNIVASNQPGGSYSKGKTFVVDARMELEQKLDFITEGLSVKGTASFSKNTYRNKAWNVANYVYTLTDGEYVLSPRSSASLGLTQNSDEYQEYQLQANYNRSFGQHNVTAMAMVLARKGFLERSGMNRNSFDSEILDQMNAGNSAGQTLNAYDSETARASYMARVNYNYAQRYLAEFNIRRDGSENFAPSRRWGTFMSASLGWVISEEKFFENLKNTVNFLKIRGSYGTLGNDNIGGVSFPFYSRFDLYSGGTASNGFANNLGDYVFGEILTKGMVPGAIANALATWEKSHKANVAIDATLFNRLNFTIDYFLERRTNILAQRDAEIPSTFGGILPLENLGEVKNQGVELSINWARQFGKDWRIDLRGNFTYNQNEYLYADEPSYPYVWQTKTGKPLNTITGYVAEGLFTSEEEVANWPDQSQLGASIMPGDIKYRDINGDGQITTEDQVMLSPYNNIPRIQYGIGLNVIYKNFDFGVFFNGSAKRKITINSGIMPFLSSGGDGNGGETVERNLMQWIADDYWSVDNPNPNAAFPRLGINNSELSNNFVTSSYWMRNGNFIRFKTLEIGYTLPYCRIYLNGDNLAVFSPFKLWDPELSWNSYPLQRTFNLGVQFTF